MFGPKPKLPTKPKAPTMPPSTADLRGRAEALRQIPVFIKTTAGSEAYAKGSSLRERAADIPVRIEALDREIAELREAYTALVVNNPTEAATVRTRVDAKVYEAADCRSLPPIYKEAIKKAYRAADVAGRTYTAKMVLPDLLEIRQEAVARIFDLVAQISELNCLLEDCQDIGQDHELGLRSGIVFAGVNGRTIGEFRRRVGEAGIPLPADNPIPTAEEANAQDAQNQQRGELEGMAVESRRSDAKVVLVNRRIDEHISEFNRFVAGRR
jgi:hypothetical protein